MREFAPHTLLHRQSPHLPLLPPIGGGGGGRVLVPVAVAAEAGPTRQLRLPRPPRWPQQKQPAPAAPPLDVDGSHETSKRREGEREGGRERAATTTKSPSSPARDKVSFSGVRRPTSDVVPYVYAREHGRGLATDAFEMEGRTRTIMGLCKTSNISFIIAGLHDM